MLEGIIRIRKEALQQAKIGNISGKCPIQLAYHICLSHSPTQRILPKIQVDDNPELPKTRIAE